MPNKKKTEDTVEKVEPEKPFKCTEPGCDYAGATERLLKQHYMFAHKKQLEGDVKPMPTTEKVEPPKSQKSVPKDAIEEQQVYDDQEKFEDSITPALDYHSTLRTIMQNNGLQRMTAATIAAFQYYDPKDTNALDELLTMQNVIPSRRKMVLKTYRKQLGLKDEEEEEVEEEKKEERKKPLRDPTKVTPEEIATWGPNEINEYNLELMNYLRALEIQKGSMNQIANAMGFGMGSQPQSAEVEKLRRELNEIKEAERMRQVMQPVIDEIRSIRQSTEQPKRSTLDELKETMLMMSLLDKMGSSKENDSLRAQAEGHMRELQAEIAKEKDRSNQIQMQGMSNLFNERIAGMESTLQAALRGNKDNDLIKTLGEAQKITETIQNLKGGAGSPEAVNIESQKIAALESVGKTVAQAFAPVIQGALQGGNKGGQQGVPRSRPMGPVQGEGPTDLSANVSEFRCTTEGCGNVFNVVGEPPMVKCEKCGAVYMDQELAAREQELKVKASRKGPSSDVYVTGAKEPSDEELRTEFEKMPDEELVRIALSKGIDPSVYPGRNDLITEIMRWRK